MYDDGWRVANGSESVKTKDQPSPQASLPNELFLTKQELNPSSSVSNTAEDDEKSGISKTLSETRSEQGTIDIMKMPKIQRKRQKEVSSLILY